MVDGQTPSEAVNVTWTGGSVAPGNCEVFPHGHEGDKGNHCHGGKKRTQDVGNGGRCDFIFYFPASGNATAFGVPVGCDPKL
jgi:hypothetical protein